MKISHRLYLASMPSVVGVLAVACLAYWGQYARAVPELLLIVAAVASVGTLIMAWINVRYVAQRVERLAGVKSRPSQSGGARTPTSTVVAQKHPDELDAIESVVTHLSGAVHAAELSQAERERMHEQRAREYAHMLATVAASATESLEQLRLPLHILLDNHFGDLNDNQEELLAAARSAAETADADLVSLKQIADIDLGLHETRWARVLPADIVRAILPTLKAIADRAGAVMQTDIEPLVPAINTNRAALQGALVTLIGDSISSAHGVAVGVSLSRSGATALIAVTGVGGSPSPIRFALATRIIAANNGVVTMSGDTLTVALGGGAQLSQ